MQSSFVVQEYDDTVGIIGFMKKRNAINPVNRNKDDKITINFDEIFSLILILFLFFLPVIFLFEFI